MTDVVGSGVAARLNLQALRQDGHGYGAATFTTAILAVSWVSVATLAAGLLLLAGGYGKLGAGWSTVGVGLLAVAFKIDTTRLQAEARVKFMLHVLAANLPSVSSAGLRLCLSLLALGEPASLPAAGLLAFAGVAAAAVGVFPVGLGLREMLAASLVPIVGISAAAGFLATALDRGLGLLVHAPLALHFARSKSRPGTA